MDRIEISQNRCYYTAITNGVNGPVSELDSGEMIIFGVKNPANRDRYLIRKELTNTDYSAVVRGFLLELSSSDTDIPPGIYCYDIALKKANGELEPIIEESEFMQKRSTVQPQMNRKQLPRNLPGQTKRRTTERRQAKRSTNPR